MVDAKVSLLIVDDDSSVRYSLCQIFRCMGHTVRHAEDGFSALQLMRELTPDVLLSDLNMPRMSGFELLSIVRRRFPTVYVIAMSGGFEGNIPEGLAADAYYGKATGLVSLFEIVKTGVGSERLSLWASRKAAPIWIPSGETRMASGNQVLIGCPDCLRAFPQPFDNASAIQSIDCAHCGTLINYAVVESLAAVS